MSETLTIHGELQHFPTSTGKDRWIAHTDKGEYSVWDSILAADLNNAPKPLVIEAKVAVSGKYKSIQEAFPVGKGSPKPQNAVIGSNSNKDNDIRAAVALKAAVDLLVSSKFDEITKQAKDITPLEMLTKECYRILKEVAE